MIIAIDGPAASGKGTLGRRIAHILGYHYLDTGLLYRALACEMMRRGDDPDVLGGEPKGGQYARY